MLVSPTIPYPRCNPIDVRPTKSGAYIPILSQCEKAMIDPQFIMAIHWQMEYQLSKSDDTRTIKNPFLKNTNVRFLLFILTF